MNRRKFCLSSAAVAISSAAARGTAILAPGVALYKFIYDRRFSAGRAFGSAAEQVRSTAGAGAVDGDITALWSRDLRHRWLNGGGAIAGMTTARTLFCLEQLAKDHWMRVLIRAEHAISGGDVIAHRLTGSQPMIARLTSVLAASDWPATLPAALARCPSPDCADAAHRAARVTCVTCVGGSPYGDGPRMADENLVSFVIA